MKPTNTTLDELVLAYSSVDDAELGEDKFAGHHDLELAKQAIIDYFVSIAPESRKLPDINEEWQEAWMHRQGGVTDYNQAIQDYISTIKECGNGR